MTCLITVYVFPFIKNLIKITKMSFKEIYVRQIHAGKLTLMIMNRY